MRIDFEKLPVVLGDESVYKSRMTCEGKQDGTSFWVCTLMLGPAVHACLADKAAAAAAEAKAAGRGSRKAIMDAVRSMFAIGVVLRNGELPMREDPVSHVRKPLMCSIGLDSCQFAQQRGGGVAVPEVLNLYIQRTTLPLSNETGHATMRLAVIASLAPTTTAVCWSRPFKVLSKQKRPDTSVQHPACDTIHTAELKSRLVQIAGDVESAAKCIEDVLVKSGARAALLADTAQGEGGIVSTEEVRPGVSAGAPAPELSSGSGTGTGSGSGTGTGSAVVVTTEAGPMSRLRLLHVTCVGPDVDPSQPTPPPSSPLSFESTASMFSSVL
jgi:hypothetical protein